MADMLHRFASRLLTRCPNLHSLPYLTAARFPVHIRCYSLYPKHFENAIIPRGEQDAVLESEAFKQVEHLPVRAALNFYSSSMFLDPLVTQFVNHVMKHGRKDVARRLVSGAFQHIKRLQLEKYHSAPLEEREEIELDPIKVFHTAVDNARPHLTTVRLRLGATWYQVPRPITEKRATSVALKWFIEVTNDKPQTKRFPKELARELIDAANYTGRVMQKKIELHKLCEANKAYAHFRWG